MEQLIRQLVQEKKEGVWWDFKLKHHDNLATLLHDVLCLANTLYDGDRYIVFGVNDNFEMIGIQENDRRNTQADIIDFFKKNSFAYHNIPNITLNVCSFGSIEIDVLVIKNLKNKPYFLTQDIIKNSKTVVRAGVIYSRLEDTNTPKDACANPYEIEAMWRERFGLNDTASERFHKILLDYNNWKYDEYSSAFYDIDPDFTIEIGESEEDVDKTRWWGTIDAEKVTKNNYNLKCKNVTLHPIQVIRFCNENLCIPYPQIEYIMHKDNCDKYNIDIDFYCDLFFFLNDTI